MCFCRSGSVTLVYFYEQILWTIRAARSIVRQAERVGDTHDRRERKRIFLQNGTNNDKKSGKFPREVTDIKIGIIRVTESACIFRRVSLPFSAPALPTLRNFRWTRIRVILGSNIRCLFRQTNPTDEKYQRFQLFERLPPRSIYHRPRRAFHRLICFDGGNAINKMDDSPRGLIRLPARDGIRSLVRCFRYTWYRESREMLLGSVRGARVRDRVDTSDRFAIKGVWYPSMCSIGEMKCNGNFHSRAHLSERKNKRLESNALGPPVVHTSVILIFR